MNSETEKIQAMLDEGTINAEEAQALLAALEDEAITESEPLEPLTQPTWPDMPARGEAWRTPFAVALAFTGIGGVKLLATRNRSGLMRFMHLLIWPFTLLSGLAALLIYLSKDAPWLHIRIRDEEDKFSFSVPYPGTAVERGLQMARDNAKDPETREKLDAAAEILAEMDSATHDNPLLVDISDEGDSVQIYLN